MNHATHMANFRAARDDKRTEAERALDETVAAVMDEVTGMSAADARAFILAHPPVPETDEDRRMLAGGERLDDGYRDDRPTGERDRFEAP